MTEAKSDALPCCPPGSIGKRPAGPHTPKGKYEMLGDQEVYFSGEAKDGRGVIILQEPFGIHAGNFAEICDWFAGEGFFAIMVDWHRKDTMKDFSKWQEWLKQYPFEKIEHDFEHTALPLLKKHNVTKLAAVGFCYGTWVGTHLSAKGHLKALSCMHPSHQNIGPVFGEDIKKIAEDVRCPVIQLAAGNDGPTVKPGGQDEAIIKEKYPSSIFKEYKNMEHGWVARGDWVAKADVWEAASEAITSTIDFFKKHM